MFISKKEIQKLAFKVRIKLNERQLELLKKEFENIVFKRLKIFDEFDLKNIEPLRYPDIESTTELRKDKFEVEDDIVGTNKKILKNNRFNKNQMNLYLISKRKK